MKNVKKKYYVYYQNPNLRIFNFEKIMKKLLDW